ncbi:3-keto-5-aminohexanoate cleavage protein [Paenarthrobacter aurescens]|uniref:3-keto-5-aminohexanoate cleavage protein n=1 Tax=Paenarthrobacter aurescens TaxID=43663 RepID=UPI0021C1FADC|nr:3-keto-5-aminohexanoate cleavage protein [Paenarthrobacter aurescens]MCT9868422.1 3-keto-5-aminohexanoate cleavage protein [Paenarthrobacter aurescens]
MMLQVCLNGARRISEHPRLTIDPAHLAQDAAVAVAAGAGAIHVHPKNPRGEDSLEAHHVASWLATLRATCPGTPLGVTTGAWSAPDAATRLEMIESWVEVPDFASVNWHEDGAGDVAQALHERGIGIEAGIWHSDAAHRWAASPLHNKCLRVLVEIQDIPAGDVTATAESLVSFARDRANGTPILLHGEERSTWPALGLAARWGLDSRIGLEDTLVLPDGTMAQGNAQLVAAAAKFIVAGQAAP